MAYVSQWLMSATDCNASRLTPHARLPKQHGSADLVVECFDNAESRRIVQHYIRSRQKPCVHAGLAANGEFGVVRWDEHFTIDEEGAPGQATCEGRGFLPLILRVSSSLVASIQFFLADKPQVNWNISPRNAESF